jgi:hypothetical protein
MQEKPAQPSKSLQIVVYVWIVAAQVWYYAQFREQFHSISPIVLPRLWH